MIRDPVNDVVFKGHLGHRHVKTQVLVAWSGRHQIACRGRGAAGAGIDRAVWADRRLRAFLRGAQCGGDVAAGAGARVEEVALPERVQRGAVGWHPFELADHRPVPGQAEPGEVLIDQILPFRPRAALVDIIDAQQEAAACRAGHVMREDGGIGVAQMQRAGGGWCKPCSESHCFSNT